MTSLKSIGRKIAKVRSNKGLSQEALGFEAGVNRGYISRIENGRVAFSVPILLKIATALDVLPGTLFD